MSTFGRLHRATALVPLAVLSAAWTASLAGVRACGSASADADGPGTLPDGTGLPPRRSRPRPASGDAALDPAPPHRRHRLDHRHPGGRARRLPARRDRHQRRRRRLPPPVAADRRDRPRRVRPRPLRRQHPRRRGRRPPRHLRHRAQRQERHPGHQRHRRRASTTTTPATTARSARCSSSPRPGRSSAWTPTATAPRNPQDIDDAALATAVYLCSGDDDLSNEPGQRAAVYRYNHTNDYVDLVLSIMQAYLDGDFTSVPTSTLTSGVILPDLSGSGDGLRRQERRRQGRQGRRQGRARTEAARATTPRPRRPRRPPRTPTPDARPRRTQTPTPDAEPDPDADADEGPEPCRRPSRPPPRRCPRTLACRRRRPPRSPRLLTRAQARRSAWPRDLVLDVTTLDSCTAIDEPRSTTCRSHDARPTTRAGRGRRPGHRPVEEGTLAPVMNPGHPTRS